MANPHAVHEPSMEEILASIRQIISEDGGSAGPKIDGVVADTGRLKRDDDAETAAATVEAEIASAFVNGEGEADEAESAVETEPDYGGAMPQQAFEDAEEAREREPAPLRSPVIMPHQMRDNERENQDEEPLLSPETDDAISGAFGALAHTLLAHNHTRTLEDVVTEMLQPMLKQWLDQNLPAIVERKVQEEIERVSRGRR